MKSKVLFLIVMTFFTAATLANEEAPEQQLSNLLGKHQGKVVYLDFWASWCIPCRKSFPWMAKMQQQYGEQGLVVLSVNLDTEEKLAQQFLVDNPIPFAIIFDPQGTIAQKYQLMGMPSSYVYGRDGELKQTHVGFFNRLKPKYQSQIEALLAKD